MASNKTIQDTESIPRDLVHEKNPMPKIEPFDSSDIAGYGMGAYTKFLFVRHPFERYWLIGNTKEESWIKWLIARIIFFSFFFVK